MFNYQWEDLIECQVKNFRYALVKKMILLSVKLIYDSQFFFKVMIFVLVHGKKINVMIF